MTQAGTDPSVEMRVDPGRAAQLVEALKSVQQRIANASAGSSARSAASAISDDHKTTVTGASPPKRPVRLVAVSKLKPANDVLALHRAASAQPPGAGQIHFGENYVQELTEKARLLPATVRWHFIGQLQSNKCKALAQEVPNLWCVESVDSDKKADGLEKGRMSLIEAKGDIGGTLNGDRLRVFVQVNTSEEEEKSGCRPEETAALWKHIVDKCPHLQPQGLMTIGAIARSQAASEGVANEDFTKLKEVRKSLAKEIELPEDEIELSMGMSDDFEDAIRQGSDEVRVGSTIFGERPPKKDAIVKQDAQEAK